jgi:small-conductance mechanosensitive channel
MKKPLLLNIISIVLMLFGAVCVALALLALGTFSHEKLIELYGASYNPKIFMMNTFYAIVIGILFFVSGLLLFKGRELGRKIFVASVLIMTVYVLGTQGFVGLQGLGIPILIIIFLYQYWGIKDYFSQVAENKGNNDGKAVKQQKERKNKKNKR